MAQYTVIQDIEAEDKFLGPLTLRQFIFAAITVILLYLSFLLITKNLWPATIVLLPPAFVSGFLAFPWGRDQPTEIWLLARIRFLLKPHRRIWDQSGLKELVTITAPKKVEETLTNGLDQTQVQSRLQALAHTLDTRGWVVKGAGTNMTQAFGAGSTDRLVTPVSLPTATLSVDTADDVLDMQSPVAKHMDELVRANDQAHRQAVLEQMEQIRVNPAQAPAVAPAANPAQQPITAAEPPLPPLPHMANHAAAYGNTHILQPAGSQAATTPAPKPASTPMPQAPKPAILGLASNDDLSVATIARQANKAELSGDNEVVISLR
jgi:hypothetical protein